MDIGMLRELLSQVQAGARVSTAIGEPVTIGERVIIPVAEIAYGGGGGGGGGKGQPELGEGSGGGGGGGVRVRPLGCLVVDQDSERWVPTLDVNRLALIAGTLAAMLLVTVRMLLPKR